MRLNVFTTLVLTASLAAHSFGQPAVTATADPASNSSLSLFMSEVVGDVRNRLITTKAEIVWPLVVPTSFGADSKLFSAAKTIFNEDLAENKKRPGYLFTSQNAAIVEVFGDSLRPAVGAAGEDPSFGEGPYVLDLIEKGVHVRDIETATLERRRVLQALTYYTGVRAEVSVTSNPDAEKPTYTKLTSGKPEWRLARYSAVSNGKSYERFALFVQIPATFKLDWTSNADPQLKLSLSFTDTRGGEVKQDVTMESDAPVKSDFDLTGLQERLGIGSDNPLLVNLGIPSASDLVRSASRAILSTDRASLYSGYLSSADGNSSVTGIKVDLTKKTEDVFGIAAGVEGSKNFYVGLNYTVSRLLSLTVGGLFRDQNDRRGILAYGVSLNLNSLFGQPTEEPTRKIVLPVTNAAVVGEADIEKLVSNFGSVVVTGTDMGAGYTLQTSGTSQDGDSDSPVASSDTVCVFISETGAYKLFRDDVPVTDASGKPITVSVKAGVLQPVATTTSQPAVPRDSQAASVETAAALPSPSVAQATPAGLGLEIIIVDKDLKPVPGVVVQAVNGSDVSAGLGLTDELGSVKLSLGNDAEADFKLYVTRLGKSEPVRVVKAGAKRVIVQLSAAG
jgi:hypothetical protein